MHSYQLLQASPPPNAKLGRLGAFVTILEKGFGAAFIRVSSSLAHSRSKLYTHLGKRCAAGSSNSAGPEPHQPAQRHRVLFTFSCDPILISCKPSLSCSPLNTRRSVQEALSIRAGGDGCEASEEGVHGRHVCLNIAVFRVQGRACPHVKEVCRASLTALASW